MTLIKTPQIILDPMNDKEFAKLIKIFDNEINLFGMRMLERSRSLLNDGTAKSSDDCSLLTELLIRSHNCFILSCSMEGISNVLETCKLVAIKLEKAGEFNIMVCFFLKVYFELLKFYRFIISKDSTIDRNCTLQRDDLYYGLFME